MVSWDDVFTTIKHVTPILGNAIASTNPVAGMAINLIAQAFGANKDDPEDILNKINSDPEYQVKLKKIEFTHEDVLVNSDVSNYKTEVEDRKDARKRQIDFQDWVPTFLAIGFLINYAVVQFYCVMHPSVNDIISARFQDVLIMIMSYYFGSMHKKNNAS